MCPFGFIMALLEGAHSHKWLARRRLGAYERRNWSMTDLEILSNMCYLCCLVCGTILLTQILLKSDHMAEQWSPACRAQFMNHSVDVSKCYAEFLSSIIGLGNFWIFWWSCVKISLDYITVRTTILNMCNANHGFTVHVQIKAMFQTFSIIF